MHKKIKILAVDDNLANLEIMRELFEEDFLLATANDGTESLQFAAHFKPDVILLDVMMPGIDGIETCRRLRLLEELADCRIIMISAKAMVSERTAGLNAGADDYVTKPFDEVELHAAIHRLLATERTSCCAQVQ